MLAFKIIVQHHQQKQPAWTTRHLRLTSRVINNQRIKWPINGAVFPLENVQQSSTQQCGSNYEWGKKKSETELTASVLNKKATKQKNKKIKNKNKKSHAIFIVRFPPASFSSPPPHLFFFFFLTPSIYCVICVIQLTSRPFLYHVS